MSRPTPPLWRAWPPRDRLPVFISGVALGIIILGIALAMFFALAILAGRSIYWRLDWFSFWLGAGLILAAAITLAGCLDLW